MCTVGRDNRFGTVAIHHQGVGTIWVNYGFGSSIINDYRMRAGRVNNCFSSVIVDYCSVGPIWIYDCFGSAVINYGGVSSIRIHHYCL